MAADNSPLAGKKHAGRPRKLTPEQQEEVYKALEDYIERTADPMIVGFCSYDLVAIKYDVTDDNINDWTEFSRLRKRATMKQQAYLATGAAQGKVNATMAIFRLKQPVHGYTDRMDSDITSKGQQIGAALSAEQAEQLIRARANRSDI